MPGAWPCGVGGWCGAGGSVTLGGRRAGEGFLGGTLTASWPGLLWGVGVRGHWTVVWWVGCTVGS
ncbi:hypothetical protein SDC9_75319 [bioreactor metagenome]|uniref:Uncharacterized protein n=1 Tax=bioreactor metagenome TaxID=1076179 RepID=A0A644YLN9_9ZZZZ